MRKIDNVFGKAEERSGRASVGSDLPGYQFVCDTVLPRFLRFFS